jgi:hypothetical protein
MLALLHPVASSAPLAGAYGTLHNGKRKIEKQRPGKLYLIFFRFQRNLGHQLAGAMSNIQCSRIGLTYSGEFLRLKFIDRKFLPPVLITRFTPCCLSCTR